MKLLLSLFFFTFSTCDLKQQCNDFLLENGVDIDLSERGDLLAQDVLTAYMESDEEGVDLYLGSIETDWYEGMDLYIGEDYDAVLEAFERDDNAFYKHTEKASISVAMSDSGTYVLIILSYSAL